jgi:hypothetical protein
MTALDVVDGTRSLAPMSFPGTNAECRNVRFRAAVGVIADVTQTSFEGRC